MSSASENRRLIIWTVILFLMAEALWLTAFRLNFSIPQPYPKRNPWYRANWERYIASVPAKPDGIFRILIVSNSQGFGKDVGTDEIYPAVLERLLNGDGTGRYEVINWSVPAGQVPEYMFLLLHAGAAQPDLIICALTPRNFARSVVKYTLDTVGSDIPLGLFRWEHLGRFSPEFRRQYLTANFMLHSLMYRHSGSLPLASWVVDRLEEGNSAARLLDPHLQNQWLFGPSRMDMQTRQNRKWELLRRIPPRSEQSRPGSQTRQDPKRALLRKMPPRSEQIRPDLQARQNRNRELPKKMAIPADRIVYYLMKEFFQIAGGSGVPVILIDQPVRAGNRSNLKRHYDMLNTVLAYVARKQRSLFFEQMTFAIPREHFVDRVHLDAEGHRQFAGLLAPLVRQHARSVGESR